VIFDEVGRARVALCDERAHVGIVWKTSARRAGSVLQGGAGACIGNTPAPLRFSPRWDPTPNAAQNAPIYGAIETQLETHPDLCNTKEVIDPVNIRPLEVLK
jgi:hypothetical protein